MESQKLTGGCLCGAVQFEFHLPTRYCGHCHCSICRRAHGAPYVTWIAVDADGFAVTEGLERVVRYNSSDHGTRSFCGTCGSSLFFESNLHPGVVDIALSTVDRPIDRVPEFHVHYDSRADWLQSIDYLPRYGGPSGREPLDPLEPKS